MPTPATKKAEQVAEQTLKFVARNGVYIIGLVLGIFVIIWLYRTLLGGAKKDNRSLAEILAEFEKEATAAGNTPTNIQNAVINIKQICDDVLEMYDTWAVNPTKNNCIAPSGKTYDIVLSQINGMGLMTLKTLEAVWNADYKPRTATNVFGFTLSEGVTIKGAIEQETCGGFGCLTCKVQNDVLAKLSQYGIQ